MDTRQTRYNMKYVMLCCTVAAFGGLLLGYDSSVISGAIEPLSDYFQLSPSETGWAVSNILLGSLIGCFIAPKLSDKLGRKNSLAITALIFTVSVAGTVVAHNFTTFVIMRMLGGLAIGLASVISLSIWPSCHRQSFADAPQRSTLSAVLAASPSCC